MNITQTTQIIANRPQSFLDIGTHEGGQKRIVFKKYNAANGNWKKLVTDLFADGASEVFIDIYRPNGSSFKFVRDVTITNDGSYAQFPQLQTQTQPAMPDQFTAYIIREKDEKIRDREERVNELKDQNRIDQDTIRELREKNWQLEKTNKFMEKEFELKRAEENLERENERKGSLEGIAETVMNNEKIMDIAHAVIMSKVQQPQISDTTGLGGIENDPSISPNKKKIIMETSQWFKMQSDEMAAKIYEIFSRLSMKPKMIDKIINDLSNNGPVQEANNH